MEEPNRTEQMDTIIEVDESQCIDCGHCVAICPTGAMHQRSMGPEDCEPIDIHLIPRWDRVRQFLISRRSIRGYINKPIELELFVEPWEAAEDRISRGAPCVIQAYAKKDDRTAPPAAMIVIAQIQLAATGLGLGTTLTGSIDTASQSHPPLIEVMGLPDGNIPYGTFVIGYPAERYHRILKRKHVDVTWRGERRDMWHDATNSSIQPGLAFIVPRSPPSGYA